MTQEPADAELLERWAHGDSDAGNALASRHFRSVYLFFRRRVPEMAEDLTQATFLAAQESRARLADKSSFRGFLLGIARNTLLMHLRRQRTRSGEKPDADASMLSLHRIVGDREEQRLLVRALRTLPLPLQLVCEMFYWEGLKAREIGDVLEISTSTVTSRLGQARTLLRERIAELGPSPGLVTTTIDNLEDWARSLVEPADDPSAPQR